MGGRKIALALIVALGVSACGDAEKAPAPASSGAAKKTAASIPTPEPGRMVGPNGQKSTPISEIKLTDEEVQKLRAGNFKVGVAWHEMNTDLPQAQTRGMKQRYAELGIKIVAVTSAEFDASKQRDDIETMLALDPDAIATLPVDPVTSASALREALKRGVKVVLHSNLPKGFKYGRDFVAQMASDEVMQGENAANIMNYALEGKGKVGVVFHDADFYVTNTRDKTFRETLKAKYPNIEIVDEAGFETPDKAQQAAQALLTRHPDLDAIYTTWAAPAEGVLAAIRESGRKDDISLVTIDLSETLALDIAACGATVGMSANRILEQGIASANVVGMALLGKPGPEYAVTTSIPVTRDNLLEGWKTSYGVEAPKAVQDAVAKGC
jgi:ribose transport system substrate-binding protein